MQAIQRLCRGGVTAVLLVGMLLWSAPERGAAQTQPAVAAFDGTEGILDPIRHEQIISLPKISSSTAAAADLLALVQGFNALKQKTGASTFNSQFRAWGEKKVAFYKKWELLE